MLTDHVGLVRIDLPEFVGHLAAQRELAEVEFYQLHFSFLVLYLGIGLLLNVCG